MTPLMPLLVVLLQPAPHAPAVDVEAMVHFGAAQFSMGTPDDLMVGRYGDGWFVNQVPQRSVDVAAFALDPHEVSVAEYARFLSSSCGALCFDPRMPIEPGAVGYHAHGEHAQQPIAWVDWRSAHWYCRWAGKRLPSEAEWERAVVGTDARPWPWGDAHGPRCQHNTYSFEGGRCARAPRPRGAQEEGASVEGVHDLAGNLAEWIADGYAPYPGGPSVDLAEPEGHRVVRGGSFLTSRQPLRAQARRSRHPATRAVDIGLRCAWDDALRDPEGVTRGPLTSVPPVETPARPVTPLASAFEVLAADLNGARALGVLDGVAYIDGNEGAYVWRDGEMFSLDLDGVEAWVSDGAAMFGVDREGGTLWRIDLEGAPEAVVEAEMPGLIAAQPVAGGWVWTDGSRVMERGMDGDDAPLAAGRTGINALVVTEDAIRWTETGDAGPALLSFRRDDRTVRQHFGPPDIAAPLRLWGLRPAGDDAVWLFVGLAQWPFSGLACRVDLGVGNLACPTHSPPKPAHLAVTEEGLVWATQFGVFEVSGSPPYQLVGDPVSATGLVVTEDAIWLTETATGRLLRLER